MSHPRPASSFASVLKHAGIYGLGNIGIRVAGLLLVPLYTYNLTPAEYGVIEYLDLTALAIGMLFSLGLGNAIYRYYYLADGDGDRRRVVSTAFVPVLVASVVVSALMIALSPVLADRIFHAARYARYLRIVFLGFAFNTVAEFGMTYLAVLQKSAAYSAINIVKFVIGALLNVWFIVGLRWGVEGILVSNLITNVAQGTLLCIWVIRRNGLGFSRPVLGQMVRYGYPLVLVQVSLFAINFGDRFFLQASAGLAQVGIYALGYKFGIMLNTLVVASFFQVWNAKSFEVAKDPEAPAYYRRVMTYFSVGLITAAVGMSLIIQDVITLVAPPAYASAAALVPLILLAYAFNGIGTYFELGVKLRDKTASLGIIFMGTALLCLGLYAVLIPRYGMFGAVAATLVAFLVKAIWVYVVSQRAYPIRFEFGRLLPLAVAAIAAVGLRFALPPLPVVASLPIGIAMFAAFVALLWVSGWLRAEERAAATALVRRGVLWLRPAAGGGTR